MRLIILAASSLCLSVPRLALAQVAAGPAPAGQPAASASGNGAAPVSPTEEIVVIAPTPLLGSGVDRDKIPANTIVIGADDLARTGPASTTRALNENASSVDLDQAVGNEFQPNLLFRGFEASPLAGDAQGLAVYVNGSRFNSSFADTTNWDLLPDIAIRTVDVVGSNPAFGLNALGGAVAVRLKDGFSSPGGEAEVSGGSFGRVQVSGQYGAQFGDHWAGYAAISGANSDGWREDSPSQVRQAFGDLGWRNDTAEVHASVIYADNNLVGNGTTPVELLDADRAAVFTYPDETRNRYFRAILNGNVHVTDTESIQANAYYSYFDQLTYNGDAGDEDVCNDPTYVCEDDGVTVLTDRNGNPIKNVIRNSPYFTKYGFTEFANGGPYSVLNVTSTVTNAYGGSAQLTSTRDILGHGNHFVVGAGYDGGASDFSAETYLGGFTLDRDYIPYPNTQIVQADNSVAPVAVFTQNDYYGLFATDTVDITKNLFGTVSGRFNYAQISLHDRNGTAENGAHSFRRFNPAGGLSYKVTPNITVYGGYAESNRAPTPSELSCANAESPCSLTNFFVGDPDLKQVVSHSYEAGANAHYMIGQGKLTAHAGVFRTDNDNDIQFVTSTTIGRAFFRNVGETRRQGAEASINYATRTLSVYGSYTYTDATFRDQLVFSNDSNPNADADGNYVVKAGNTLPGIPKHAWKFGAQYKVLPAWTVGMTGIAASGQYLFGDEGNQSQKTSGYCLFNFNTEYQIRPRIQLFGEIENMFGARYETYGTFAPTSDVPIAQVPGASNPRALTPGAPVGGFGGVRVSF